MARPVSPTPFTRTRTRVDQKMAEPDLYFTLERSLIVGVPAYASTKPSLAAFSKMRLTLRAFDAEGLFFLSRSCAVQ